MWVRIRHSSSSRWLLWLLIFGVTFVALVSVDAQTPTVWPPPTCLPPFSAYGCVLATWDTNNTATAAARTATSPFNTPTPPGGFFPTSTGFIPSDVCPTPGWDDDDLDPQWASACSHCLADSADSPLDPFAFSTFGIALPGFDTPSPFPTVSTDPTITPTYTASPEGLPQWRVYFDGSDTLGWSPGSNGASVSFMTDAESSPNSAVQLDGSTSEISVNFHIPSGVTVNSWEAWQTFDHTGGGGLTGVFPAYAYYLNGVDITTAGSGGGETQVVGSHTWTRMSRTPNLVMDTILIYLGVVYSGGTTGVYIDSFSVTFSGTPTMTATVTHTTTPVPPTATFTPSRTPIGEFNFNQANCTAPVYRDIEQAVDFEFETDSLVCYRLFPEIDTNILGNVIQIRPIEMCFQYYNPTLEVVGLVMPVDILVVIGLATFLIKWGLFN